MALMLFSTYLSKLIETELRYILILDWPSNKQNLMVGINVFIYHGGLASFCDCCPSLA